MIWNFSRICLRKVQMCYVLLITLCWSFCALSVASSQHSIKKTRCVLPLMFIWNKTLIHVLILMWLSSGNMCQTVWNETQVAVLYTNDHLVCVVRDVNVQYLWTICAHKWNGGLPRDTVDQVPILITYTTILQRTVHVLLLDSCTSCISC
jgi:hypothetical protein